MRRYLLLAAVLCQPLLVNAAELHDATGRTVQIPDHATRILPAGPPAAVLLEALAPDLMVGWPHVPTAAAHAWLPEAAVALPTVPMLTARQDMTVQVAGCNVQCNCLRPRTDSPAIEHPATKHPSAGTLDALKMRCAQGN
jgi:hypothetical protein